MRKVRKIIRMTMVAASALLGAVAASGNSPSPVDPYGSTNSGAGHGRC